MIVITFFLFALTAKGQDEQYGILNADIPQLNALPIGTVAPNFEGIDQNNNHLSLNELIESGSVVLIIYRGSWCGYCEKNLAEIQSSMTTFRSLGAQVVAITPEKASSRDDLIARNKIEFPIIVDHDQKIMQDYNVAFHVAPNYQKKVFMHFGESLSQMNNQETPVLPIPACYVISAEKEIIYSFYQHDYAQRVSVEEILSVLE